MFSWLHDVKLATGGLQAVILIFLAMFVKYNLGHICCQFQGKSYTPSISRKYNSPYVPSPPLDQCCSVVSHYPPWNNNIGDGGRGREVFFAQNRRKLAFWSNYRQMGNYLWPRLYFYTFAKNSSCCAELWHFLLYLKSISVKDDSLMNFRINESEFAWKKNKIIWRHCRKLGRCDVIDQKQSKI